MFLWRVMGLLLDYHEYTLCLPKYSFDLQSAKHQRIYVYTKSGTSPMIPNTTTVIWKTYEFHHIIWYTNLARYEFHSKNGANDSCFVVGVVRIWLHVLQRYQCLWCEVSVNTESALICFHSFNVQLYVLSTSVIYSCWISWKRKWQF